MNNLPLKYGAIMRRQGFSPGVVIIAFAIVVLFVGGAVVAWKTPYLDYYLPQAVKEFLGKSQTGPNGVPTTSDTSEPSSQDSEPTAEDLTKGWKIYTNEEFGFSFKYPDNLELSGDSVYPTAGEITSFRSKDKKVGLSIYKDFQGGFEHWSSIEDKDYYTATGIWVPTTIMYGEDDPNEVTVHSSTYDAPIDFTLLFVFNKATYQDGLSAFEMILSSLKFF